MAPVILSGQFNNANTKAHYDRIYEDLKLRASEVKPNESKAVLVQQNPIESMFSAVSDTFEDGKNVIRAAKTGKMGDNSLGRINDLGLKAGVLLIASFLATHAKTKTNAAMQFIGGGAFLASMSLWPKIFINLPARIIHGFPVDRKYISAQGDKKDFGLDNQFYVWDAVPKETLRKDAKRAGIDYDAPLGKEKIQRKEEMVMVQTRTLNLATVGAGAPLMTSLFGNFIEPKVKRFIINHDFKRVKNILNGNLDSYLNSIKTESKSNNKILSNVANKLKTPKGEKEIKQLFADYAADKKAFDNEFFKQLAQQLDISDILDEFKDSDGFKPLNSFSPRRVAEELQKIWEKTGVADKESLQKILSRYNFAAFDDIFSNATGAISNAKRTEDIMNAIGDNLTVANIKKVLIENGISDKQVDKIINSLKFNNEGFQEAVLDFNKGVINPVRARLTAYVKNLLNPVVGSQAESKSTQRFDDTLNGIFKKLSINPHTKELKENSIEHAQKVLSDLLIKKLSGIKHGSEEYKNMLPDFVSQPLDKEVKKAIEQLLDPKNIEKIYVHAPEAKGTKALETAVYGEIGTRSGIVNALCEFIKNKVIDMNSVDSKAIICANFEARVNAGEFADLIKDKEQMEIARQLVYNGCVSSRYNNAFTKNFLIYNEIIQRIFNKEAFEQETALVPDIKDIVEDLRDKIKLIDKVDLEQNNTLTKSFLEANSFAGLVKTHATKLQNNKNWLKTFGPMAIILVAVTLLIQPFFGNIDKEFPKEDKKRGV